MKFRYAFHSAAFLLRTAALVVFVSFVSLAMLRSIPGNTQDVLQGMESVRTSSVRYDDTAAASSAEPTHKASLIADYKTWLFNAVRLNFGTSMLTLEPVRDMIMARWKTTALLALVSFALSLPLAVLCARALDADARGIRVASHSLLLTFMSFTPFTLGLVVIAAFTVLRVPVPIFVADAGGGGIVRFLAPLMVLTLVQIPLYTQPLVTSIMIVKQNAFVAFAYVQGFSPAWIWWREMLPSAALFSLDIAAIQFGYLLGGTVIVESIFSLPGVGSLLLHSVLSRDVSVVQAIIACSAVIIAIVRVLAQTAREILAPAVKE